MTSILSKTLLAGAAILGLMGVANAHGVDIRIGVPHIGIYAHPHYYHPYYGLNYCQQYDVFGNCIVYGDNNYRVVRPHYEHYHNEIIIHHHR